MGSNEEEAVSDEKFGVAGPSGKSCAPSCVLSMPSPMVIPIPMCGFEY